MRVAFVTVESPRELRSEGARRLDRFARALAARDHDVTVCCSRFWGSGGEDPPPAHESDGVTYRSVAGEPSSERVLASLPSLIRRVDPEVIHAGIAPGWHPLAIALAASLSRTPVVLDWSGQPGEGRLSPRTFPSAPILVPSSYVHTRARERGSAVDRLRILPGFVERDRIDEVDSVGAFDVVTTAYLDGNADVESLLLALRERDDACSAAVLGDGPHRERLERQVRDLGLSDRVSFLGDVPTTERIARYRGARVFVEAEETSSFAHELLCALVCGCAGIAEYRADSAAHELVERRERGFPITDPSELVGALDEALALPYATSSEGFEAFDADRVLGRLLVTYRETIEGS
ncbi:glycosyltransferase [Natronorarus salvus]|uniref:glycosyltransferase n=1 Tax=Natronorarus salvus TaxID=3117733 RepID=UPI002F26BF1E